MDLITGASGFIGARLVTALHARVALMRVVTRTGVPAMAGIGGVEVVRADLASPDSLAGVADGIDAIFHLAGYAHADDANDVSAEAIHERVTVEGTRNLLAEAERAGVRRFVFASSVKAAGEGSATCVDETMPSRPETAYGRAKRAAEELILEAGARTGMHVSILRLPLVYGPGNKGNIPRMIASIARGRFPPLPVTHNRRSMVHVDDVVQALLLAAESPEANNKIYYVTDGRDYSTHVIYDAMRAAIGLPPPRLRVPRWSLRGGALLGDLLQRLTGRHMPVNSETLDKLLGSAWYSNARIVQELGFHPGRTLPDSLPEIVASVRGQRVGRP